VTSVYDSLFLHTVARAIVPIIQVFAFSVITHGHYSPGGGFQGGVILAASIILLRISLGEESYGRFPRNRGIVLAGVGALCFALLGFVPLLFGGRFLDYGLELFWLPSPTAHYWGIFLAEVFIGLLVWGSLVAIYDALATGGEE
jgi:multicomponent Na+:H+ antiporter subunit B